MRIDENFRFWTFISREGYEKKTDASACLSTKGAKAIGKEKMAFYWKEVTIDEFLKLATTGHAFCNLFNFYYDTEYWFETSKGIKYKTKPLYEKGKNAGYMKLEHTDYKTKLRIYVLLRQAREKRENISTVQVGQEFCNHNHFFLLGPPMSRLLRPKFLRHNNAYNSFLE